MVVFALALSTAFANNLAQSDIQSRTEYTYGVVWPTSCTTITSPFGPRTYPINDFHYGVDIGAAHGANVAAAAAGIIKRIEYDYDSGYGNVIYLNSYINVTTPPIRSEYTIMRQSRYAHLSEFAEGLSKELTVSQGQIIGYVGSTGFSTGPHLHFEMRILSNINETWPPGSSAHNPLIMYPEINFTMCGMKDTSGKFYYYHDLINMPADVLEEIDFPESEINEFLRMVDINLLTRKTLRTFQDKLKE